MKNRNSQHLIWNKYRLGKIPWNKGKKWVQIVSEETRKKLSLAKIGNTNNKWKLRSEAIKQRLKLTSLKWDKNPRWRWWIAKDRRTGSKYSDWRKKIFSRDNYTCQACHTKWCYLEVHHIKSWAFYPELRYEDSNWISLCKLCHSLTDNYKWKNVFLSDNRNPKSS